MAWLRADNAAQARVMVRFYDSRYSTTPLGDYDLAPRFDGTTDWVRQWRDLDTPERRRLLRHALRARAARQRHRLQLVRRPGLHRVGALAAAPTRI